MAVAVVLENLSEAGRIVNLKNDAKTRRTQPWSRQRDLRSMFKGNSMSGTSINNTVTTSRTKKNNEEKGGSTFVMASKKKKNFDKGNGNVSKKKRKKGGIASFFCK